LGKPLAPAQTWMLIEVCVAPAHEIAGVESFGFGPAMALGDPSAVSNGRATHAAQRRIPSNFGMAFIEVVLNVMTSPLR
jgi:hypothetical protein